MNTKLIIFSGRAKVIRWWRVTKLWLLSERFQKLAAILVAPVVSAIVAFAVVRSSNITATAQMDRQIEAGEAQKKLEVVAEEARMDRQNSAAAAQASLQTSADNARLQLQLKMQEAQTELQKIADENLNRREMMRMALEELVRERDFDKDGLPDKLDDGQLAIREWAVNVFVQENKGRYPEMDSKGIEALRRGSGIGSGAGWGYSSYYTPSGKFSNLGYSSYTESIEDDARGKGSSEELKEADTENALPPEPK